MKDQFYIVFILWTFLNNKKKKHSILTIGVLGSFNQRKPAKMISEIIILYLFSGPVILSVFLFWPLLPRPVIPKIGGTPGGDRKIQVAVRKIG